MLTQDFWIAVECDVARNEEAVATEKRRLHRKPRLPGVILKKTFLRSDASIK